MPTHKTGETREPIRTGDTFKDAKGRIWEVFETKPGGVIDLFCKERSLSTNTYTRCIRSWIAAGTFTRIASSTQGGI